MKGLIFVEPLTTYYSLKKGWIASQPLAMTKNPPYLSLQKGLSSSPLPLEEGARMAGEGKQVKSEIVV